MSRMNPAPQPALEGTCALPDGRSLGFATFGDPAGKEKIFWLHGTPGARRQIPLDARAYAEKAGVWIIGVDRPGIGWSTPHVYDDVLGFAKDLEHLADHLGIGLMHVVGLSGGAPYALAAGAAMPDRVTTVGVIGGVAPAVGPDAAGGGMVAVAKPLAPVVKIAHRPLGAMLWAGLRVATPVAPHAVDLYRAIQPAGDRRLLGEQDFRAMFIDDLVNGSRDQFSALLFDLLMFTRDWGFRLADVHQPVRWWHGHDDHIIPFRHGEHAVRLLPNAELIPLEGEAHLGGLGFALDIVGGIVPAKELIEEVVHADDH
jgi:pimeloyl-ACP methyl ester carboxylesterase